MKKYKKDEDEYVSDSSDYDSDVYEVYENNKSANIYLTGFNYASCDDEYGFVSNPNSTYA